MKVVHLVARLGEGRFDLREREHAAWLWERVGEAFDDRLLAMIIMPNHVHVLALAGEPDEARARLARICGHLARRLGTSRLFERLPAAQRVEHDKVARVARYIALNANRAGLVEHPLQWPWTTLRDVVGAAARPLVDPRVLAHWTDPGRRRSARSWLEYVAADDRVTDRRPLASAVPGTRARPAFGIDAVHQAVAAALRCDPGAVRRRGRARVLLIAAALDQGISDLSLLADLTRCTRRAVEYARHRPPDVASLSAVRQCLADPRLTARHLHPIRPVWSRNLTRPVRPDLRAQLRAG